jgi:kynurenine--oxoglutarate transaminase/cysteine-S-conjugate beta-lyase/glutamine--phenylpyruvate transaminase
VIWYLCFVAPKLHEQLKSETDARADYRFVKWMTKSHKLQCIPASAFYSDEHKALGENYVRVCFIKVRCRVAVSISEFFVTTL